MAWSIKTVPNVCSAPAKTYPAASGTQTFTTNNGPTYFDAYAKWGFNQSGREQEQKAVEQEIRRVLSKVAERFDLESRRMRPLRDRVPVGHRLEVHHAVVRGVLAEHLRLVPGRRVAEPHENHEAVELRLRQREGALVLDWVLRGDNHEGAR